MKKIAKVAIKQATRRKKWYSLNVSPKELRLDVTLTNGQCFNWKKYPMLKNEVDDNDDMKEHPHFFGVLGNRVFLLKQTKDDVFYHVLNEEKEEEDIVVKREKKIGNTNNDNNKFMEFPSNTIKTTTTSSSVCGEDSKVILHDYFQLDTNLEQLYMEWCKNADNSFVDIANSLYGMRILRQDPVECLFSFLCSSCNNIIRITQMLDSLRKEYGTLLYKDDERDIECYSFPTIEALDKIATEKRLRELGMGYRAVFIKESARELNQPMEITIRKNNNINSNHSSGNSSSKKNGKISDTDMTTVKKYKSGIEFLNALRTLDRMKVKEELTFKVDKKKLKALAANGGENITRRGLTGVGPKVADCVALFSLDQVGCVPVDTHVIQIAIRDFDPALRNVSLTKSVHERVGNLFRDCYGPYAGWAHSLLFAAELPQFEDKLPTHVVSHIKKFKDMCKEQNALKKLEKKKRKEMKANEAAEGKKKKRKQKKKKVS